MKRVCTALIRNNANELLVVKKMTKGGEVLFFPGGKSDDHETIQQTLARELHEELGVTLETFELLHEFDEVSPEGRRYHYIAVQAKVVGEPALQPGDSVFWFGWMTEEDIRASEMLTVPSRRVLGCKE